MLLPLRAQVNLYWGVRSPVVAILVFFVLLPTRLHCNGFDPESIREQPLHSGFGHDDRFNNYIDYDNH